MKARVVKISKSYIVLPQQSTHYHSLTVTHRAEAPVLDHSHLQVVLLHSAVTGVAAANGQEQSTGVESNRVHRARRADYACVCERQRMIGV